MNNRNEELINHLIDVGVLKSDKIKTALQKFPREKFVPPALADAAYEDHPLPIGQGQTISQPYTVIFMLELLDVRAGDNILEIGAGSGWQTALLSYLASIESGMGRRPPVAPPRGATGGHVWAYEINESVGQFGHDNLSQFKLNNADYVIADASQSWNKHEPYQKIISGAAFAEIPAELKNLLARSGRLVAPTQGMDVRVIKRVNEYEFKEKIFPGFVFVPITHKNNQ